MNQMGTWHREHPAEIAVPEIKDWNSVADDIYKHALHDAQQKLHPLLRETEPYKLRRRHEFVDALKRALEKRIAQRVALWYSNIQAIYRFDESWVEARHHWDGTIHMLVHVPRVSNPIRMFGRKLDRSLTDRLRQLGWSRFRQHESVLEVLQVTSNELRHGVGYGAMFYAVYSAPVKVWPANR